MITDDLAKQILSYKNTTLSQLLLFLPSHVAKFHFQKLQCV